MFIKYANPVSRPKITKANITKLVPRLRIPVNEERRRFSNPEGPEGRLSKMKQTVTALFKYERIELNYSRADEARGYAERLISEAIRHGPHSRETFEMANYWITEKQIMHKLFKVLVPRFEFMTTAYTQLYRAPRWTWSDGFHPEADRFQYSREINRPPRGGFDRAIKYPKAVLELRGHPFPPLYLNRVHNPRLLHNVLLAAAKEDKRKIPSLDLASSLTDHVLQAKLSASASSLSLENELHDQSNKSDSKPSLQ